jgi:hypothetical protein
MSRVVPLVMLLLATSIAMPSLLVGQATREQLEARVERLTEMVEQARTAEAEAASRHDTVRAGRLLAIAPREDVAYVGEMLEEAWYELIVQLGDDTLAIEERYYAYHLPDKFWPAGRQYQQVNGSWDVTRDVHQHFKLRLDPGGAFLDEFPVEPMTERRRGGVYVQLATAESQAVRSCWLGDNRACRDALALTNLSDPVSVWYSPDEQRRIVARGGAGWTQACIDGSDEDCHRALSGRVIRSLRPLEERARLLLVEVALKVGGAGALQRMLAAGEMGFEERLLAAARLDADSLVALWRTEIKESADAVEYRSPTVPSSLAVAGLAWIVVFILLSTRSTRWRLG